MSYKVSGTDSYVEGDDLISVTTVLFSSFQMILKEQL